MSPFVFVTFVIGGLMPIQAAINTQLSSWMKHPIHAAFFSFLGGTLTLGIVALCLRVPFPSMGKILQIPVYLWIGGLLGSIVVGSAIYLVPRIGTATLLASALTGQMVGAITIDHYGFFGVPVHSVSLLRVLGVGLLLTGVFLIQKR